MMLPTHVLGGMVLALPLVVVAPEFATVGLVAALLGGLFPDLDLYLSHRQTLHYPVYFSGLAIGALCLALVVPSTVTISLAFFLLSGAVHSVSDVFGSGLELRPWEGNSNRAVYDHFHGQWVPPRRLIRYDGSPEDVLLSVTLAVPLLVLVDGVLQFVVLGLLGVAIVYAVFRRSLATAATVLVQFLPTALLPYVPPRYLEENPVENP